MVKRDVTTVRETIKGVRVQEEGERERGMVMIERGEDGEERCEGKGLRVHLKENG